MTEPKKEITLMQAAPWIALVVLGYMLWAKQDGAPSPEPKPVAVTIEKATSGIYSTIRSENARIFNEAAKKIRAKEIQFDKQLFDYVIAATEAARKAANKPFDVAFESTLPRDTEGSFRNVEEQAAKVLERVAKSW